MNQRRLRIAGVVRLLPGETRTFSFDREGEAQEGFVLRHPAGCVAYANRCPHWGVDLDLGDARFYADDIDRIYCKTHGALFRPLDGVCDQGPCLGEALEPFPVELDGDDAWVTLPPGA